jgi:transposase
MCAAISENAVSTHIPYIGPYNTQLLLSFLNTLYRDLITEHQRGLVRPDLPKYAIVWNNVSFHRTNIVREWFAAHERTTMEFRPPSSPFLNLIE